MLTGKTLRAVLPIFVLTAAVAVPTWGDDERQEPAFEPLTWMVDWGRAVWVMMTADASPLQGDPPPADPLPTEPPPPTGEPPGGGGGDDGDGGASSYIDPQG